jgi:hypothetical protein
MFENLRDANPPIADDATRDAVAGRALRLRRHRHLGQAGAAIVAVVLVSVGTIALLNGGSASSTGSHKVAAASKRHHGSNVAAPITTTTTATPTTTVPTKVLGSTETTTPKTHAPAPAAAPSPAPPAPASASGHLTGHPGFALTFLSITGPGGTFGGVVSGDSYSVASVPAGTYDIAWQAESPAVPPAAGSSDVGTAAIAGHTTITLTPGSNTVDIS